MPCCTAVASTYGLNDDPTCSRVSTVSSAQSWQYFAGTFAPGPP